MSDSDREKLEAELDAAGPEIVTLRPINGIAYDHTGERNETTERAWVSFSKFMEQLAPYYSFDQTSDAWVWYLRGFKDGEARHD